jgi:thiamine-monophosphate kinase
MGGRPRWCVVSVAAPADYPRRSLTLLHAGIDDAAAECGACIIGGNVTASSRLSVSLTLIAEAPKRTVTRRGARPGDRIFVTGTVGDAALGLSCLQRGWRQGGAVRRYREPLPRLEAGKSLVESGLASAMIDVSDGLIQDLGHICEQSRVGAVVEATNLPRSYVYRRQLGDDLRFALSGGEDYELLCTVPQEKTPLLAKIRSRLHCAITRIGTVTKGTHVDVIDQAGVVVDLGVRGYDHFTRGRFDEP